MKQKTAKNIGLGLLLAGALGSGASIGSLIEAKNIERSRLSNSEFVHNIQRMEELKGKVTGMSRELRLYDSPLRGGSLYHGPTVRELLEHKLISDTKLQLRYAEFRRFEQEYHMVRDNFFKDYRNIYLESGLLGLVSFPIIGLLGIPVYFINREKKRINKNEN